MPASNRANEAGEIKAGERRCGNCRWAASSYPPACFRFCLIRLALSYNFYPRITTPTDLRTLFYSRYRVSDAVYYLKRLVGVVRSFPVSWPAFVKGAIIFKGASAARDSPLSKRIRRVSFDFYVGVTEFQALVTLPQMRFLHVYR